MTFLQIVCGRLKPSQQKRKVHLRGLVPLFRCILQSKQSFAVLTALLFLPFMPAGVQAQNSVPDPDLQRQDVPHGVVTRFTLKGSRIYPGAEHQITLYVPAQYDKSKPACVMIFQDGLGFNAPTVFDNLIAKKQMPVCVAIGVAPGVAPPGGPDPANALPRYNRSVEYDTPDDTYARFLFAEVLREVGKTVNLSVNPDDRALCGGSSGGIAAFTAAWERPDQFHRVYSVIGSFTDLAGGDTYPSKIRKSEPKPLRVFLQDNDRDQDIYSGSWPLANQEVAAALKYAGYDYQFVVGQGGHDGRPGSQIFPTVLRWLWRDYPAPIKANLTNGQPVTQLLAPGEEWQRVRPSPLGGPQYLASNAAGDVFALTNNVIIASQLERIDAKDSLKTRPTFLYGGKTAMHGLAFTPDGRLLSYDDSRKALVSFDMRGGVTTFAGETMFPGVISHQGIMYFEADKGNIRMRDKNGLTHPAYDDAKDFSLSDELFSFPALRRGVVMTLSPDQSLLITTNRQPHKALTSWRIQADGTLTDRQPFFDLAISYNPFEASVNALVTDAQGWLYAATPLGIQVCDQAGRVNGIIAPPDGDYGGRVFAMTFGGPNHDILYVATLEALWRRKLRVKGVLTFQPPVKPPAPRL